MDDDAPPIDFWGPSRKKRYGLGKGLELPLMLALWGLLRVSVLAAAPSGLKEGCLLHGGPVCLTAWICRLPSPSWPRHTLTLLITETKAGEEVLQSDVYVVSSSLHGRGCPQECGWHKER